MLLNQGEHSGILLTFIKLQFVIKIFILSIFEWKLKTGFTVCVFCLVWLFTSQSTAMVMSGWSIHLITLFSCASLINQLTSTSCTYFRLQLTTSLLESVEGRRMAVKLFHDQSLQKYESSPGANSRPLDLQSDTYLQSDTLLTALCCPVSCMCDKYPNLVCWLIRMYERLIRVSCDIPIPSSS